MQKYFKKRCLNNHKGEDGIRTHGTLKNIRQISNLKLSTTQPPLQVFNSTFSIVALMKREKFYVNHALEDLNL